MKSENTYWKTIEINTRNSFPWYAPGAITQGGSAIKVSDTKSFV